MALNIFWFLPTHGDGRYLGTSRGARAVDHSYLQQIAQAADKLGYGGVLIPTGRSCEDSWLVAASLIPVTQRLKFLVALRPGIISPTVAARQAATLDRLGREVLGSIDRSKLNVNGSSLATGHPFAATGGRIVATLAKMLEQNGGGRGLISICAAGGQGVTAIMERP